MTENGIKHVVVDHHDVRIAAASVRVSNPTPSSQTVTVPAALRLF
jgi:hypothetical protein